MKKTQGGKTVSVALRQLLQEGMVGTHEEICRALEKQGYSVNQTKVSRLLHQMGAIKVVNQKGQYLYRLPHEHGLMHEQNISAAKTVIKHWVIDVVSNQSMIVIHTTPGAANLVAREIDLHQLSLGILGSIAGDDTILIIPRDENNIKKIVEGIMQAFSL